MKFKTLVVEFYHEKTLLMENFESKYSVIVARNVVCIYIKFWHRGVRLGGMTVQIVIAFGAPIWLVTMC